jgi:hypothetical protein
MLKHKPKHVAADRFGPRIVVSDGLRNNHGFLDEQGNSQDKQLRYTK